MTKLITIAAAAAGVAITAVAANRAIRSTDNINRICQEIEKYERDHTFKVSGRVHNVDTNNKYFEPDGKRKLIKALEKEGFYNIEIFYHDEEKIIVDCYTTDDEFSSNIMVDIVPLDETDDKLSEFEDSMNKMADIVPLDETDDKLSEFEDSMNKMADIVPLEIDDNLSEFEDSMNKMADIVMNKMADIVPLETDDKLSEFEDSMNKM